MADWDRLDAEPLGQALDPLAHGQVQRDPAAFDQLRNLPGCDGTDVQRGAFPSSRIDQNACPGLQTFAAAVEPQVWH
jgi:hypothetical protein